MKLLIVLWLIWKWILSGFTTDPGVQAGDPISSSHYNTYIRDNIAFLLSGRARSQIIREGVANYTTSSTSFVAVDTTNLRITLTVATGRVRIRATGIVQHSDTASGSGTLLGGTIDVDIQKDATTRAGGTNGLWKILQSNNGSALHPFAVEAEFTGLSVGSHTFDLMWKTSGATATMMNNAYVITMTGEEF
jgi:hypothetical protein